MHYLVLGCDVAGDCPLRPQFADAPALPDLPADLAAALISWNERMASQIARMTEEQAQLDLLNREVADLAERIASAVPDGAKLRFVAE
jgi:hypothetical protein